MPDYRAKTVKLATQVQCLLLLRNVATPTTPTSTAAGRGVVPVSFTMPEKTPAAVCIHHIVSLSIYLPTYLHPTG